MTDHWEQARLNHRAQQGEAIAGAALSLLLEHGASGLTMAAIAESADISRQTLYRYYPDVDAVLVGVATLIAAHDDQLEIEVQRQSDPSEQLDVLVRIVAGSGEHHNRESTALLATLPPKARAILTQHEDRVTHVLVNVLQTGISEGAFRTDLDPAVDAPLILGLANAASDPAGPDRAIILVHRMVDHPQQKEQPK